MSNEVSSFLLIFVPEDCTFFFFGGGALAVSGFVDLQQYQLSLYNLFERPSITTFVNLLPPLAKVLICLSFPTPLSFSFSFPIMSMFGGVSSGYTI